LWPETRRRAGRPASSDAPLEVRYTMPWSSIASATFLKPAMFAPFT
jgi:hypothetical protein